MSKPSQRPPLPKDFHKRHNVAEQTRIVDGAFAATARLYCDVFALWGGCSKDPCRRHRRCAGEAFDCLRRRVARIPPEQQGAAMNDVIAGGPRRLAPRSHAEWSVRRMALSSWLYVRGGR